MPNKYVSESDCNESNLIYDFFVFCCYTSCKKSNQHSSSSISEKNCIQKLHFIYNKWLEQALLVESSVHPNRVATNLGYSEISLKMETPRILREFCATQGKNYSK